MIDCPNCGKELEPVEDEDAFFCTSCLALYIGVEDDEVDEQDGSTPGAGELYH